MTGMIRALPATWRLRALPWARIGKAVCFALMLAMLVEVARLSPGSDAHAYWAASLDHPYLHGMANTADAYMYSPAFLQALTPLRVLPWSLFWAAWVFLTGGILLWLVGAPLAALLLVPSGFNPMFTELWYGNVVMPMAVVLALGTRWPALWSFMLLTKVTPGIGLVWFAVRREWRQLAIALGVTAGIVAVSVLLAPQAWVEWIATLRDNAAAPAAVAAHIPPIGVRLVLATGLVALGAWRNWPAILPLAIIIALPVFWFASMSLLLVWIWQMRQAGGLPFASLVGIRQRQTASALP